MEPAQCLGFTLMVSFEDVHYGNSALRCQVFQLLSAEDLLRAFLAHKPFTAAFISLIMKIAETHLFSCFTVDNSPRNVHPIVFIQIDRNMLHPKHKETIQCFGFKFVQ
jgi:uncharacterized Zn-finger protein